MPTQISTSAVAIAQVAGQNGGNDGQGQPDGGHRKRLFHGSLSATVLRTVTDPAAIPASANKKPCLAAGLVGTSFDTCRKGVAAGVISPAGRAVAGDSIPIM